MKRFEFLLVCLIAGVLLPSCGRTRIECTVESAPQSKFVLKQLNVSTLDVLDTVKTNSKGVFRYSPKIADGQPQFLYIYYKDRKIASLLLYGGEKMKVWADTLGNYSLEGSVESEKLRQIDSSFTAFGTELNRMASQVEPDRAAMSRLYVDYYRKQVRYLMENKGSMTAIPVLYQKLNGDSPILSQATDAIYFRSVCDTLSSLYPESAYVQALEKETVRREKVLSLQQKMLSGTDVVGFPPLEITDIDSKPVALGDVHRNVTLLHFWNPEDAAQKMFTMDVLKPLYAEFHPHGFDIYSVGLTRDKVLWATVVKAQQLDWTNVCDGLGDSSPCLLAYNLDINRLPVSFLLDADGSVINISTSEQLRKEVSSRLSGKH